MSDLYAALRSRNYLFSDPALTLTIILFPAPAPAIVQIISAPAAPALQHCFYV